MSNIAKRELNQLRISVATARRELGSEIGVRSFMCGLTILLALLTGGIDASYAAYIVVAAQLFWLSRLFHLDELRISRTYRLHCRQARANTRSLAATLREQRFGATLAPSEIHVFIVGFLYLSFVGLYAIAIQ